MRPFLLAVFFLLGDFSGKVADFLLQNHKGRLRPSRSSNAEYLLLNLETLSTDRSTLKVTM